MANPVTQRYLDLCRVDGSPLRDVAWRATYPPHFAEAYRHLTLPRPMFLDEAVVGQAAADAMAIFNLVVALPDRLFGGDRRAYCEAMGIDDRTIRVVLRASTGRPPMFGRADMIFDGSALRLIELNVGSELGGLQIAEANRALMDVPEFRQFAQEHQLSYVDTGAEVVRILRRAAKPVVGDREPVIVLLEWTDCCDPMPIYHSLVEPLVARGLNVHLAEIHQVVNKDDKLYLGDLPIDLVFRYFMLPNISADPRGEEIVDPVMRAHEAGKTPLFAHLETTLCSYKDNLVFLSDPRFRHAFSAEEAALIDRVLPWTRRLVDEATDIDGQTVGLLDYCRAHREELVAKPHAGYGAHGTVAGREVSAEEWNAVITTVGGEYVVQRRVAPEYELVLDPRTDTVDEWLPIWGVFFTDRGYTGTYIRAQRSSATSVIAYTNMAGTAATFSFPSPA